MYFRQLLNFTVVSLLFFILSVGCKKNVDYLEGIAKLRFEKDTLSFDTVFTQVGSATRYFKIYNDENQPVLIDAKIKNGSSPFRMNIDGRKGNMLQDIEIGPHDSIYVFLEVTVNPDQPLTISPFIIEDKIIINNGSKEEAVLLIAYGQNANYIPSISGKGGLAYLSCNLNKVVWNDPKPYVIYGLLVIDSCELNIPEGTRIYVHGGIAETEGQYYNDGQIIVINKGRLNIKGSAEKKVEIQGDRLESAFKDVAGQWVGIRILNGSKNNIVDHVIIKNSIVGISVDSACTLNIQNSEIKNTATFGLFARHAKVYGDNLLIYNNGLQSIGLSYGGDYTFYHCTLSSDINQESALSVNNYTCDDPPLCLSKIYYTNKLKLKIENSIIVGGSDDELSIDPFDKSDIGTERFDLQMANSIVKVKEILKPSIFPNFFDYCKGCYNLKSKDELFIEKSKSNYRLDTMSVGLDKGTYIPTVPFDILNKSRSTLATDLGCYEF